MNPRENEQQRAESRNRINRLLPQFGDDVETHEYAMQQQTIEAGVRASLTVGDFSNIPFRRADLLAIREVRQQIGRSGRHGQMYFERNAENRTELTENARMITIEDGVSATQFVNNSFGAWMNRENNNHHLVKNYANCYALCEQPEIDNLLSTESSCSICLCSFKENPIAVKTSSCEHVFHKNCLDEWLRNKDSCPNCRKDLA